MTSVCIFFSCAFSSTPKFNEVKCKYKNIYMYTLICLLHVHAAKNGLIVKKEWLLESYDKKRRLPASR